ncbi:MAG TPA: ABC transporter permease subunit, partial [Anaerolineae bacterium]|nr:ABC transporter permease subunit [Anaerolineae bacterium]
PEPSVVDAVDQYLKNLTQFGIILALLLTMGLVTQERESGTAALVLVKPLPRSAFLGAKLCAMAITFLVAVVFGGTASFVYTWFLFEPLRVGAWSAMNGLLWLYLMVYVALALLASTLSRSLVVAGALGVGLMAVMGTLGALPALREYLPGRLLVWGAAMAFGGSAPAAWPALWASLGIILVSWITAWLIFLRQEL